MSRCSRHSGKHAVKHAIKHSDRELKGREDKHFERFNEESAEAYIVKEMLMDSWLKQGEEKYGSDISLWRFKCPKCGAVGTGNDFIQHGLSADKAYTACIGNVNHRIGCNWTSDNIFHTLGKGIAIYTPERGRMEVFPFAD